MCIKIFIDMLVHWIANQIDRYTWWFKTVTVSNYSVEKYENSCYLLFNAILNTIYSKPTTILIKTTINLIFTI